jgi:hypothetical protein
MLNLHLSSAPRFSAATQEVLAPGFPSDSPAARPANSDCFLSSRHLQIPVQSCRLSRVNEHGLLCSLTSSEIATLFSLPALANRGPGDCAANSSSAAALCDAACGTHDTSGVVPPGNACRRGPRGRPSRDNHGGPDHRFAPGPCLLEAWDGP